MDDDNLIKRSWRQLAFDVPRFRTNAKSRRRVLIQLLLLVMFGGAWGLYLGGLAAYEYRFAGGWWAVLWVAIMYALAFSIRRVMKNRGNAITLSIDSTPSPHLRMKVLDQRLILATVVARGAFEAALRSSAIGGAGWRDVRATQNQRLRGEKLWDALAPGMRDLLAAAEGSWSEAQAGCALVYLEAVKVLNWAVLEDCELVALRTSQTAYPEVLACVLKEPDPARTNNFLRSLVELDREEGPARVYFSRLTSELVQRGASDGLRDENLDRNAEQYMAYASSVGEADIMADDLPVGGVLIAEAETGVLLGLRWTTAVRLVTLEAVREILERQSVEGVERIVNDVVQR